MKKQIARFLFIFVLCLSACNDEEQHTQHPAPQWSVEEGQYSGTMSAIVVLPSNLTSNVQDNDELAAFVGESCRAIADPISGVYFLTIKGTASEQSPVSFRYYSAGKKYLYTTGAIMTFEIDAVYGSVDNPQVLDLTIVE